jgi:hypothetical protein
LVHINLPPGEAVSSPQPADAAVRGNGYSTAETTGPAAVDGAAVTVGADGTPVTVGIDGAERPESFLNRLGNKLGEALRMLVSKVIGWVAGFFSSLLN